MTQPNYPGFDVLAGIYNHACKQDTNTELLDPPYPTKQETIKMSEAIPTVQELVLSNLQGEVVNVADDVGRLESALQNTSRLGTTEQFQIGSLLVATDAAIANMSAEELQSLTLKDEFKFDVDQLNKDLNLPARRLVATETPGFTEAENIEYLERLKDIKVPTVDPQVVIDSMANIVAASQESVHATKAVMPTKGKNIKPTKAQKKQFKKMLQQNPKMARSVHTNTIMSALQRHVIKTPEQLMIEKAVADTHKFLVEILGERQAAAFFKAGPDTKATKFFSPAFCAANPTIVSTLEGSPRSLTEIHEYFIQRALLDLAEAADQTNPELGLEQGLSAVFDAVGKHVDIDLTVDATDIKELEAKFEAGVFKPTVADAVEEPALFNVSVAEVGEYLTKPKHAPTGRGLYREVHPLDPILVEIKRDIHPADVAVVSTVGGFGTTLDDVFGPGPHGDGKSELGKTIAG